MIDRPRNQHPAGRNANGPFVGKHAQREDGENYHCNRRGVANGDRNERDQDDGAAPALQPESHREQPTHGWIDAVKHPQPRQSEPGPDLGHAW
jgi:hypothetical protein